MLQFTKIGMINQLDKLIDGGVFCFFAYMEILKERKVNPLPFGTRIRNERKIGVLSRIWTRFSPQL